MSPDERMRLRKQPHKDEPGFLSPASVEDDFQSVLAEPYEYHERHDSAATTSTTTAKSFRELHKKLLTHSLSVNNRSTSDRDDEEAVASISDGRRTPLPPVEDDTDEEHPDSDGKQAVFYTPEASSTPLTAVYVEKHTADNSSESFENNEHNVQTDFENIPEQTTVNA